MILIKNGNVIDAIAKRVQKKDILIDQERIIKIGCDLEKEISDTVDVQIIDAKNHYVSPGFIDLHVHLREPGFEYKETIYTGSRACAKGGYTTVFCMPNTKPALDNVEIIQRLNDVIQRDSVIDIIPVGAITLNIEGKTLSNHIELLQAGVKAFSDDGRTTMNPELMRIAFENSKHLNIPIFTHSEDHDITSEYTNQPYPVEAESNIIERDIQLCELEDGILHVSHVSSNDALQKIKLAKNKGLKVTCEAAPHHFALNEEMVDMTSTLSKVNPPIRSKSDQVALLNAIKEGVIDVIATDHAPHDSESKNVPYRDASFGISGIESAFTVSYSILVMQGWIDLIKLISMLTDSPARIGQLRDVGVLKEGYYADITIFDLEQDVKVQSETFISKGKNTPFEGFMGKGKIVKTIFRGKLVYELKDENLNEHGEAKYD